MFLTHLLPGDTGEQCHSHSSSPLSSLQLPVTLSPVGPNTPPTTTLAQFERPSFTPIHNSRHYVVMLTSCDSTPTERPFTWQQHTGKYFRTVSISEATAMLP